MKVLPVRSAECSRAGHRPLVAWATRGPGPLAVLIWTPIVLIQPISQIHKAASTWLAAGLLAVITLTFVAAMLAAQVGRWNDRYVPEILLVLQVAVTVVAATTYGGQWYALYTLVALAMGALLTSRWTPLLIAALTAAIAGSVWVSGSWDQAWGSALAVFLTGMGTYGFHRLFAVIAELDRTREELARTAVSQERLRFSRDLHDLLGHTLSVMVVKAEVVRRLIPRDPDQAAAHASDIESLGRQGLVEVRQAVNGYRGAALGHELERARTALAAAGITARISGAETGLPHDADSLLGWVVREGVTNVIRHSGARTCTIRVSVRDGAAHLDLLDDGPGAEPAGDGRGIRGIRERIGAAGGIAEIGPRESGFGIGVQIPCPA